MGHRSLIELLRAEATAKDDQLGMGIGKFVQHLGRRHRVLAETDRRRTGEQIGQVGVRRVLQRQARKSVLGDPKLRSRLTHAPPQIGRIVRIETCIVGHNHGLAAREQLVQRGHCRFLRLAIHWTGSSTFGRPRGTAVQFRADPRQPEFHACPRNESGRAANRRAHTPSMQVD